MVKLQWSKLMDRRLGRTGRIPSLDFHVRAFCPRRPPHASIVHEGWFLAFRSQYTDLHLRLHLHATGSDEPDGWSHQGNSNRTPTVAVQSFRFPPSQRTPPHHAPVCQSWWMPENSFHPDLSRPHRPYLGNQPHAGHPNLVLEQKRRKERSYSLGIAALLERHRNILNSSTGSPHRHWTAVRMASINSER